MLYIVTVTQGGDTTYTGAVHAPEGTPEQVLKQACIDSINAGYREDAAVHGEELPKEDYWDDRGMNWLIMPVDEPLRLSVPRVAQYRKELKV